MTRKGRENVWKIVVLCFLLVVLCILCVIKLFYVRNSEHYTSAGEVLYNPLMGFAVNADYPEAVGENTLVYVDITWREWEPQEGVYAIEAVKETNYWEAWKAEGKHVVLRFVCDIPTNETHMDIPDWLYAQTKDGIFYDTSYGKGYAPEYSNAIFIEKHRNAIRALGKAFEKEDMIAYVELGSLGHWGEWHMNYAQGTTRIPQESIREEYVKAYEDAFPYAKLLARRPFAETAKRNFGLFNDMTGHLEATREWLSWMNQGGIYSQPLVSEAVVAQRNIWDVSPIGGEFTSALSYDDMLDWNLAETLELLRESHTTFIGPKCPILDEVDSHRKGVEEVLKTIGYRYGISEASICHWKWMEKATVDLTIENRGVAPIYYPWQMYLYVYDEANRQIEKILVPVNLTDVTGGESIHIRLNNVPIGENYVYGIGIENPISHKPSVSLDMNCPNKNKIYFILK